MKIFRLRLVLFAALGIFGSFLSLLFWFHYQCGMWHLFPIKINYAKLEYLLANKQWIEADRETAFIYKQVVRKYLESEGLYGLFKLDFLGQRQAVFYMGELPCQKLETLDSLWLKYSEGHFGFSVQAQMLNDIESDPKSTDLERSQQDSKFKKKVITWNYGREIVLGFDNSTVNPERAKGRLPSDLWASYAPVPNRLDILKPLRKYHSCIKNEFDYSN